MLKRLIDKLHELYIIVFNAYGKNFVITYRDKQARITFGKTSKQFREDCEKLCLELGLDKALIMGDYNGRLKLHFSHQIKKRDRQ